MPATCRRGARRGSIRWWRCAKSKTPPGWRQIRRLDFSFVDAPALDCTALHENRAACTMLTARGMDLPSTATFQIDTDCRIQGASDAFCRMMRCTPGGIIGRDVHDLIREDWRRHYRSVVERARHGTSEIAVPLIAPCGLEGWFTHTMEPVRHNGAVTAFHVTVVPRTSEEPLAKAS